MPELMQQLHDIEGLDPIPWWPLGVGWWVVMGCAALLILAAFYYLYQTIQYQRSWKYDASLELANLEAGLTEATARETAVCLSEYVRRIAVRRHSRKECAGLTGEAWLVWLKRHDPKQFDWEAKGRLLVEAPYAPDKSFFSMEEIKIVIQAVKRWVR